MFFKNSFYFASNGAAINFLIWTPSLFFLFRLFYLSTRFVSQLESSASIHWLTGLTNFFPSFWLFLMLFWRLEMLVTVHQLHHVSHASQITTSRTIFTERLFGAPNEWVRYSSHAFLIAYHKTLTKKLFTCCPEKVMRRKKEKKKQLERQLQSFSR